jgi:hypothetical protein
MHLRYDSEVRKFETTPRTVLLLVHVEPYLTQTYLFTSSLRDLLLYFLLREVDPYRHSLPTVWPFILQIAMQDISIPPQAILSLLCSLLARSLPCSSHLNSQDTTRHKNAPLARLVGAAWSSLITKGGSIVSTLCSCIEKQPRPNLDN